MLCVGPLSLLLALAAPALPRPPATARPGTAAERDLAFLTDLAETRSWRLGQPGAISLTPDGGTVLFLRSPPRSPEMRLHAMDVATGAVRELITPSQVLGGATETLSSAERERRERMRVTVRGFTSYALADDGRLVLVELSGKAYVVPVAGGTPRLVAGPDAEGRPILDPKVSPDGRQVAFVRAGELWVAPAAGGSPRRLTSGATAVRTHAQAEFVAAEELGRYSGFFWSPDSRSLVYEEADAEGVERLWLGDPSRPTAAVEPRPYPRPGGRNVKVSFGIVPVAGGRTTWIAWDRRAWEYVAEVSWQRGGPLTLVLLSRDQRARSLVKVDPRTGRTTELLREQDEAWVDDFQRAYRWLADGTGFLWSSDASGALQLQLRASDGALVRAVTPRDFGFASLVHVDERGRTVVVARSPEPVERQLWRVPLDGGEARALTSGPDWHEAVFAREAETCALTRRPREGPPSTVVLRADGSRAGSLPSVAEAPPFDVRLEVAKVGPAPGFWTAIVRPHDFDPRKKYPVILEVYGGPSALTVRPMGTAYVSDQWIADHGYIVLHADNRGTPGRGRAWERAIQGAFATVPLEDQVAALAALAAREPAIDLDRVGVMGHSFGGYLAALSVLRRPDVFRAAVAGAPVVDWMNYDTAYTERYLGVPPPAGRSDAYERNGLLPYASGLARPLLLLHGTADDNVHFSESLLLEKAIFAAGRSDQVDFVPIVGQTHLFYEPHLMVRYWQRVFGFLEAHLQRPAGAVPRT